MVHKAGTYLTGKTKRNIDVLAEKLTEEFKMDKEFLNRIFHKLPTAFQVFLAEPYYARKYMPKFLLPLREFPLYPKGEEKVAKRRYGVFTIKDNKLYWGYVMPKEEGGAEVRLRKVF